jgi:hypothetical protein
MDLEYPNIAKKTMRDFKKYHAFRHAFRHAKKNSVKKSHAFRHAFRHANA